MDELKKDYDAMTFLERNSIAIALVLSAGMVGCAMAILLSLL